MIFLIITILISALCVGIAFKFWNNFSNTGQLRDLLFTIEIDNNWIIINTLHDWKDNYYFKALAKNFDIKINNDGFIRIPLINFLKENKTKSSSLLNNVLSTLKKFHDTSPSINYQHEFDIRFDNANDPKRKIQFKMTLLNYEPTKKILYGKLRHHLSFYHKEFFSKQKNKIINYNIDKKITNIALLKNKSTGIVFYLNFNPYLSKLIGKKTGMLNVIKNNIFDTLIKKGFLITNEKNLEFYIFKFGNIKKLSAKKIMKQEFEKCYNKISKSLSFNLPFECGIAYIRELKNINTIISVRRKARFIQGQLVEKNNDIIPGQKNTNQFSYRIFNVLEDEKSFKKFTSSYLTFATALKKANFVLRSEPVINNGKSILIGNLIDILPVDNIAIFQHHNLSKQIKQYNLISTYDLFALHKLKDHLKNLKTKETYIIRIFSWTLLNHINQFISTKNSNDIHNNKIIILINDFEKLSVLQILDIKKRLVQCGYRIALYNISTYENIEKFLVLVKPELIFISHSLTIHINDNVENKTIILALQKLLINENTKIIISRPINPEDSLFLTNYGFNNWIS